MGLNCCKRLFKLIWRLVLAILGFLVGITCSLIFYEFVLRETDFDDAYKVLIFFSTATFLSLGFALSKQMACITLLTLPEFAGRAGRRSLQATILILVLSGPVHNLGENGEETLRFFACVKDMLWDIFMAGVDLVLAPLQQILFDLKKSAEDKQHDENFNATVLKDIVMAPILEEVEDSKEILQIQAEMRRIESDMGLPSQMEMGKFEVSRSSDESERIVQRYRKKVAYRCEEIFSKGMQSCIQVFQDKYDACSETMSWDVLAYLLCWPMKLDIVCNILSDFSMGTTCDKAENLVSDDFGKAYTFVRRGIDDFTQSFNFRINYQGLSEIISLDSNKEKRDALLEQFLESKKYVQWYLTMIKRCLTLSYLFVVFGAINYHKGYLRKLSFDNQYLTQDFLRIDKHRRSHQKTHLLPLKSFEKQELISVKRFLLTAPEQKKFMSQIFAIFLQAGVVFTLFALDYIFRELLGLLENHAEIQFSQEGLHVLAIQVKGSGFLAQMMRKIVKDFQVRKEIDLKHFTKLCLPHPRQVDTSYVHRIIVLFTVLLLNAYFEAHCVRFRHCIADFLFGKRYKRRTVWLYNEMLRRRRRKLQHLKRKVLENAARFKTYMPQNPAQLLTKYFPKCCACLRRCRIGRRKCILCLANGATYKCPRCGFSFCGECFADVERRCLHCIAKREEQDSKDHYFHQDNYYDDHSSATDDHVV